MHGKTWPGKIEKEHENLLIAGVTNGKIFLFLMIVESNNIANLAHQSLPLVLQKIEKKPSTIRSKIHDKNYH